MRGTQIRNGIPDGANGSGEPLPRPLLRPSPSANLVGDWKGDPLGPQVAAPSGLPNRKQRCAFAQHWQRRSTIVAGNAALAAVIDLRYSTTTSEIGYAGIDHVWRLFARCDTGNRHSTLCG